MIDIHSHVLPGIDDGAEDLETAVRMCRMAAADGCRAMIATPHQRHVAWANGDRRRLEILRESVQSALGPELGIYLGAEIRVDSRLLADLDPASPAEVTPLAGSSYLLIEFPRDAAGEAAEELIHELCVAGWRPIVAHPEFIPFLADDLDRMLALSELGALFQITAASLEADFGAVARRQAHRMVDRGLIQFIASDCHSDTWRPPGLSRARELVRREWGEAAAEALTSSHPAAILADLPLADAAAARSVDSAPAISRPGPAEWTR